MLNFTWPNACGICFSLHFIHSGASLRYATLRFISFIHQHKPRQPAQAWLILCTPQTFPIPFHRRIKYPFSSVWRIIKFAKPHCLICCGSSFQPPNCSIPLNRHPCPCQPNPAVHPASYSPHTFKTFYMLFNVFFCRLHRKVNFHA